MAAADKPIKYKSRKAKNIEQYPGAPSARHTKLIPIPVAYLKTLKGLRKEQEILTPKTPAVKGLIPLVKDKKFQREHPILLEVMHDGSVVIADGNHRTWASVAADIKTYLCKVKYYGGGEKELNIMNKIQKAAVLRIVFDKLVAEGKLSPADSDMLDEGNFSGDEHAEIAHHLSTNMGADCKDPNCQYHSPSPMQPMPKQADSQGISGATDLDGGPGDSEWAGMHDQGLDYGGEHDTNKGDQRTVNKNNHPAVDDIPLDHPMVQKATSYPYGKASICRGNECNKPTKNVFCNDCANKSQNKDKFPDFKTKGEVSNETGVAAPHQWAGPEGQKAIRKTEAAGVEPLRPITRRDGIEKDLKSSPTKKVVEPKPTDSDPNKGNKIDIQAALYKAAKKLAAEGFDVSDILKEAMDNAYSPTGGVKPNYIHEWDNNLHPDVPALQQPSAFQTPPGNEELRPSYHPSVVQKVQPDNFTDSNHYPGYGGDLATPQGGHGEGEDDAQILDPHLPTSQQTVNHHSDAGIPMDKAKIQPRVQPNDFTKVKKLYTNPTNPNEHAAIEGLPFSLNSLKRVAKKLKAEGFDVSDILIQIATVMDPMLEPYVPKDYGIPSKEMSPYGWIGPKGEFYHVPGFAQHHKVENSLIDNGKINNYEDLDNNYVHVSPEDMRLPKNLNDNHLSTLFDYHNAATSGKFDDVKPLEPRHKAHIKSTLDTAIKHLENNNSGVSAYATDNRALDLEKKIEKSKKTKSGVRYFESGGTQKQPKTDKYKNKDRTKLNDLEIKANKFNPKEHRQHDHVKESEEAEGKSAEEADEIAWATVNKQKHSASSNKPCKDCGMPTDKCACKSSTNMSPGYANKGGKLGGTQRVNNPVKVSKTPPELNPGTSTKAKF